MISVHPPVHRHESLKAQLGIPCWKQGLTVFFTDNVPISHSTGRLLVGAVAKMMDAHFKGKPIQDANWVELGSGSGIFARQLLDIMDKEHPEFYDRFSFTITDSSQALIDQVKHSGLLNHHLDHVRFETVDFHRIHFKEQPNGVYFSYLFDSLPTAHLHIVEGKPFVVKVETQIPENLTLIDTDHFPPTILSGDALLAKLRAPDTFSAPFARRVNAHIQENYVEVPLEKSGLSDQDQNDILEFLAHSKIQNGYFNVQLEVSKFFANLHLALSDDALVLIHDFGHSSMDLCQGPSLLTTDFGAFCFYAVFFPYIQYVGQKYGFDYATTSHYPEAEYTQFMAFSKTPLSQEFVDTLNTAMPNQDAKKVFETTIEIGNLIKEPENHLPKIESLWTALTPAQKQDYCLITKVATGYLKNGDPQTAITLAETAAPVYQKIAIPLQIILAQSFQAMGDLEKAEQHFKKALDISPYFAPAYFMLGSIYASQKRSAEAQSMLLHAIKLSTDLSWHTVVTVGLLAIQNGQKDLAKTTLNWIIAAHHAHPDLVKPTAFAQAEHFIKLL